MVFLGREISEQRNYSEKVAVEIDEEVKGIIDAAYTNAKELLTDHKPKLDQIVRTLLEEETLEGEELVKLLEASTDDKFPLGRGAKGPSLGPNPSGDKEKVPPPKPTIQPSPGLAFESGTATNQFRRWSFHE